MDSVKFVVDHLNKPPFDKTFNVISFDSLTSEELFQIVSDVLQEISVQEKVDVHLEDFEHTVIRVMNTLLILKYKPLSDSKSHLFKQNLIQGNKNTIYSLLEWLLSNFEELKKRMYLAKFLVKVDVPSDILGDSDIAVLYQQYAQLIEEFKKTHKENVSAKNVNKISVSELKSDGVTMEKEKEIVSNRIYHLKKKIDALPNIAAILRSTRNLRLEYDRKKEISWQQQEEAVTIQQCQQRLLRLSQQLQELKKRSIGLSAQALLKKLEEEIYVTSYIANQKLPRELKQQRKEKEIYETIGYSNTVTKSSNDVLDAKIQSTSQQISKLVESRISASASADDKTVLFRQQAAIVARKKDNLAEKYSELKKQLQEIQSQLEDRQQKLEEVAGESGVVLKSNEKFQEYVNKLRTRSLIYKRHRNDLAVLKAESGLLSRTVDILRAKSAQINVDLAKLEEAQDTEQAFEVTENSSEALLAFITQTTANISSQKAKLIPLVSQVKPLQEEMRQLNSEHAEKKRAYDRTSMALNTSQTKLVTDVNALEEQHNKSTSEIGTLNEKIQTAKTDLKRAHDEFQASVDKNNTTPLIREQLQHKIGEGERYNRLLKDEQKQVRENEEPCMKQKNAWNNLQLLMRIKLECLEREQQELKNIMHLEKGAETLVIL